MLFATSNPGKLREAQAILAGVELLLSSDFGVVLPEENGTTFEENATQKSKAAFEQTGIPTLSEDSGLVVDALNGAPGIYSARYAGNDKENLQRVLRELGNVKNRRAKFVCVAAYTDSTGTYTFRGELEGEIAHSPIGEGGFGYDPIFLFDGTHTTAQISQKEKDAISHRGKALRAFLRWLGAQNEKA